MTLLARLRSPGRAMELILLGLLLCLVAFSTRSLTLPGFIGFLNDDGAYANFAKALASGLGYVDLCHPEHPAASRYPIVFPALLAGLIAGVPSWTEQVSRLQWVPVISAVAFVGLAYVCLRRLAGWSLWPALAATAVIAFHPATLMTGSQLLPDLLFAAICILGILVLDRGLRTEGAGWRWWTLGGVLIAGAFLTRYAGVALVLAVGFSLLKARRLKALAWVVCVFTFLVTPWVIFRQATGGENYLPEFMASVAHNPALLLAHIRLAAENLLSVSLPGLLAPTVFNNRHPLTVTIGLVVSLVTLIGAFAAMRRSAPAAQGLGAAYLLLTLAEAYVFQVGFIYHGAAVLSRYLIPVAPFVFIAFARGVDLLWSALRVSRNIDLRRVGLAALSLSLVGASLHLQRTLAVQPHFVRELALPEYEKLFAFARDELPPGAKVIGWFDSMNTLYTGHFSTSFLLTALAPEQVLERMATQQIKYVLATPKLEPKSSRDKILAPADPGEVVDRMAVLVQSLQQTYPGLLSEIYTNATGDFKVYRVNQGVLERSQALRPGAAR